MNLPESGTKWEMFYALVELLYAILLSLIKNIALCLFPKKPKGLKGWDKHNTITQQISSLFKNNINSKKLKNGTTRVKDSTKPQYVTILRKSTSVVGRSCHYKANCYGIDVTNLDSIISINTSNHTAWIESNCTMGDITDTLLSFGYILKVTPELENISIGGAINGLGVETSSFRYGMIHHITKRVEIILPTSGKIVQIERDYISKNCHKNEYDGLFQCISGSFNSIALVTAVEIELLPCKSNTLVKMEYQFFDDRHMFLNTMKSLCENNVCTRGSRTTKNKSNNKTKNDSTDSTCSSTSNSDNNCINLQTDGKNSYDFIEGLRLRDMSDKGYVLCLGTMINPDENENQAETKNIFDMSKWYQLYWYAHVCEMFKHKHKQKSLVMQQDNINKNQLDKTRGGQQKNDDYHIECMRIRDYLFRHDRGVFWNTPGKVDRLGVETFNISKKFRLSETFLFRFIFGSLVTCEKVMAFRKLRDKSDELNAYRRHTHDYAVPLSKTMKFLDYTQDGYFDNNTLLWFCPLRVSNIKSVENKDYLFAPLGENEKDDFLMDIGIYGYIPDVLLNNDQRSWYDTVNMFVKFDRKCTELGGTKAYYSSCFLSQQEFWSHFDKKTYDVWRNKLKSYLYFPDIYEKVGLMGRKYANVKPNDPLPFDLEKSKMSWFQVVKALTHIIRTY